MKEIFSYCLTLGVKILIGFLCFAALVYAYLLVTIGGGLLRIYLVYLWHKIRGKKFSVVEYLDKQKIGK